MWPWGHVAFAYVCYSLAVRALRGRRPTGAGALVVAGAALGPDLIDKPLAWTLHVTAGGYAVAHSVLVAGPVVALSGLALWSRGRGVAAGALVLGYYSHFAGDVVYPVLLGRAPGFERFLWPVFVYRGRGGDFLGEFAHYFSTYVSWVVHLRHPLLIGTQAAIALATLALWALDGFPGPRALVRAATGLVGR